MRRTNVAYLEREDGADPRFILHMQMFPRA